MTVWTCVLLGLLRILDVWAGHCITRLWQWQSPQDGRKWFAGVFTFTSQQWSIRLTLVWFKRFLFGTFPQQAEDSTSALPSRSDFLFRNFSMDMKCLAENFGACDTSCRLPHILMTILWPVLEECSRFEVSSRMRDNPGLSKCSFSPLKKYIFFWSQIETLTWHFCLLSKEVTMMTPWMTRVSCQICVETHKGLFPFYLSDHKNFWFSFLQMNHQRCQCLLQKTWTKQKRAMWPESWAALVRLLTWRLTAARCPQMTRLDFAST